MEQPGVSAPASASPKQASQSGCMKWGLIGCGVLSALLIVGLVFMTLKARDLMEVLLAKTEKNVLSACGPEVTPPEREAFQAAYRRFVAKAKDGKVPVDRMTGVQGKVARAISDRKVTPDELRDLTAAVEAEAGAPGK